jgi:UDPglucose 6-dehydrogenase
MANVRAELGDRMRYAASAYEATDGADALVLVTEWHEFRRPDFTDIKARMRGAALFDGRNVWSPDDARKAGFRYYGIGRPTLSSAS